MYFKLCMTICLSPDNNDNQVCTICVYFIIGNGNKQRTTARPTII